jgi:hypothetical protein
MPQKNVLLKDISATKQEESKEKASQDARQDLLTLLAPLRFSGETLNHQPSQCTKDAHQPRRLVTKKEVAVWVKAQAAKPKEATKGIANQKSGWKYDYASQHCAYAF